METNNKGTVTISIERFKQLEFIEKGVQEKTLISYADVTPYGSYYYYYGENDAIKKLIQENSYSHNRLVEVSTENYKLKVELKQCYENKSWWSKLFKVK